MSWQVVEAKWPVIRDAFRGFDPEAVASLSPVDLDRLEANPDMIRNRRKLDATVHNAEVVLDLVEEHGDFHRYLRSHSDPGAAAADLKRRFEFIGDGGARWFLRSVGEEPPPRQATDQPRRVAPRGGGR